MVGSTGGRVGAAWALDSAPLLGSEVGQDRWRSCTQLSNSNVQLLHIQLQTPQLWCVGIDDGAQLS